MKYNTLTGSITLAILLTGSPSLGAGSDASTKNIATPNVTTPKVENLSSNLAPLSSKSESLSSKLETLSGNFNSGFDMDELPKGWKLVDSSKTQDVALTKTRTGVEILGDNYTFYTDVPKLKSFDKTTFLFSAELRSTKPGAHIQYYDGKNSINSTAYKSKKSDWETLTIEFTVDAKTSTDSQMTEEERFLFVG